MIVMRSEVWREAPSVWGMVQDKEGCFWQEEQQEQKLPSRRNSGCLKPLGSRWMHMRNNMQSQAGRYHPCVWKCRLYCYSSMVGPTDQEITVIKNLLYSHIPRGGEPATPHRGWVRGWVGGWDMEKHQSQSGGREI